MGEGVATILGRKLRMTQLFDEGGLRVPVTVIEAGPCKVLQVKSTERDGYEAIQVAFGSRRKKASKPLEGHLKKAGAATPRWIREIAHPGGDIAPGAEITLGAFEGVKSVDVSGTSKGRGTAGTIKRWGLGRGPVTHGSKNVRASGSTGQGTDPARVFKGKKMPGRMGAEKVTILNLPVVRVEAERHLLFVRGPVPGPAGGVLMIRASERVKGA